MNYNLLTTFLVSILIIFILIIIGNFVFYFLSKNKSEKIQLNNFIFQGIIFGFSFFIIIGYILSYLTIFNSLYIGIISLGFFLIAIIFLYYKKGINIVISKKDIITILFFLLISIFIYKYSFNSIYPYGYDQGKHFGNMIYLLNNNELSFFHPGTNLKEYYFQAPNILIGYFVSLSEFFKNTGFKTIDDINNHLLFFKIFFTFFSLIYIYLLSIFAKNTKEFISYIIFFLFISVNGFFNAGSIGTFLTFFFILGYIFYDNGIVNNKNLILMFLGSIIFLIHPIAVLFFVVYKFIEIFINIFKKDFNKIKDIIIINIISLLSSLLFLFVFYKVFLYGFKDEIIRKYFSESFGENIDVVGKTFFEKNLDNILIIENIYIILFFILIGIIYIIKKKDLNNNLKLFFFVIVLFLVFKISPLIKTGQFTVIIFSILGGLGSILLFQGKKKLGLIFYIILFLLSTNLIVNFIENGYKRFSYVNESTYNQGLKINELSEGINGTIVVPSSGSLGFFTYGLNSNVLIAEPRYTDMYSMLELSKLYEKYFTNKGNIENVLNYNEYTNILNKYNVKGIIGSKYQIINRDLIEQLSLSELNIDSNNTLYILK